jgi:E3 ubiquitin-protein ligase FANCL
MLQGGPSGGKALGGLVLDEEEVEEESLWCDPELAALLSGHTRVLRQRLAQSSDVPGFLLELQQVATRLVAQGSAVHAPLPPPAFFTRLVRDLGEVGWDEVVSFDDTRAAVVLTLVDPDSPQMTHRLSITLPPTYPRHPPECSVSLPAAVEVRWEPETSSLASVLAQYEAALPRFRDLWAVLADWDKHTHVLEPSNPSAASVMRRVALGRSRSLSVEVDYRRPWDLCECRFFGPDQATEPLKRRLREGVCVCMCVCVCVCV